MSTLLVNDIKNAAGTGAPTFSKGIDKSTAYLASSNATITVATADGYEFVFATGTSGTQTINLPAAASNAGRILKIKKTASGGTVVVDANASETIDGATTYTMSNQYETLTLVCDGTGWNGFDKTPNGMIRANNTAGYGSTGSNKILRYTNQTTTGTAITYAAGAADGDTFTINEPGVYSATVYANFSANSGEIGISINSNQLTTSIESITTAHRLTMFENAAVSGVRTGCSVSFRAAAGDVLRAHTNGVAINTGSDAIGVFVVTQLARF